MCIIFRDKSIKGFFKFPFFSSFSLHLHKMEEKTPRDAQGHMLEKQGQAHLPLEPELNLGSDLEMVFLKLI